MKSTAKTVAEYLDDLPADRQEQLAQVRQVILANLPPGYEEVMNWGMITYQVPLDMYPDTYNKKPLMYAALASQKNYMSVYLSGIYADESAYQRFIAEYKETGKKLDIGKSCVRFRHLDNLPLELIGKAVAAYDVKAFVELAKNARTS
jgi:hypothetical protein